MDLSAEQNALLALVGAVALAIARAVFTAYGDYQAKQARQHQEAKQIISEAPEPIQDLLASLKPSLPLLQTFVRLAVHSETLKSRVDELEDKVLLIPELEKQIAEKDAELAKLKAQRDADQQRIAELELQVADLRGQLEAARG